MRQLIDTAKKLSHRELFFLIGNNRYLWSIGY